MSHCISSNMRLPLWAVGLLLLVAAGLARAQQPPKQQVYVALYERGPAWPEGKSITELPNFEEYVAAHIHAVESRLVGEGAFADAPSEAMVGMMVFSAASDDDAQKLAESDPFVIAKYTRVTKVLRWQVNGLHGCS